MKTLLQSASIKVLTWMAVGLSIVVLSGNAAAQNGDNIIRNGQFTTNLTGWSSFVADFAGVGATIASTNGEAAITNITNAGGEVWHVQLFQVLTAGQIDSLVLGATYAISFDARSPLNGRQLRMFFGQEGGDFAPLKVSDFQLTTEMKTYTVKFTVPVTFTAMKLGFEMGLNNASVFIDNVSLIETEPEGVDLPANFDDPNLDYKLVDFGGTASEIITDPTDSNNKVVRTIKTSAAELWAGTTVGDPEGFASRIPLTAENTTMSVRVWSPDANIPVRLKIEAFNDPTISVETETKTTVAGEWETLVFDFKNQATGTAPLNLDYFYNKASIFFNFGTTGAQAGEKTYYWDDMAFGGDAGETPPPVPVGFVAFNRIGETPVESGQVFLAAGPNNVTQENIAYRLYYAKSSANLQNPRLGTEYVFGGTAGDGDGKNAFGFVISGLQAGTPYTFWLYQYNTASKLFSPEPAVATATSGGTFTNLGETGTEIPFEYVLGQNYPNPFNPSTSIQFALPESGQVQIDVYNMVGHKVMTVTNGTMNAGYHVVTLDASSLSSGLYIYRLKAGNVVLTKKMTLVK
jgi:hypothetical protein